MSAFLLSLFTQFWPYLVGVAGVGAALWKAFSAGKKSERLKQAEADREASNVADKVDNDIGAMPTGKVREELGKWSKR